MLGRPAAERGPLKAPTRRGRPTPAGRGRAPRFMLPRTRAACGEPVTSNTPSLLTWVDVVSYPDGGNSPRLASRLPLPPAAAAHPLPAPPHPEGPERSAARPIATLHRRLPAALSRAAAPGPALLARLRSSSSGSPPDTPISPAVPKAPRAPADVAPDLQTAWSALRISDPTLLTTGCAASSLPDVPCAAARTRRGASLLPGCLPATASAPGRRRSV